MASPAASRSRRRFHALGILAGLTLSSVFACSGDTIERGQIMLSLQTDLALPKDVSRIRIQVLRGDGAVRFDATYNVGGGPEDSRIPATLGIVGDEAGETVEIRVIGFKGSEARTLNKTVTTMPTTRTALLRMPIQWLCDGAVTELDGDTYESTCEPVDGVEHACLAGSCVPVEVDSESLPDYAPGAVFGGGNGQQGSGKCFPTQDCMDGSKGFDVMPDMSDCSVEVPADDEEPINVAVKTGKTGGGACKGDECYVPLDRDDDFGWRETTKSAPGVRKVKLPSAVCERIKDGRAMGVRASRSCETKTAEIPTCGPWSSVSGNGALDGGVEGDASRPDASPVDTMCRGFIPGQDLGELTGNPKLDPFLQASGDLKRRAEELKADTVAACLAILGALGRPGSVDNPPTDEELTEVCIYDLALRVREGYCLTGPGQDECEADCGCSGGLEERCSEVAGVCDGACFGDCHSAEPVPCDSFCDGICKGECSGECQNPEAPGGCGACNGTCSGTCDGVCSGTTTCEGVCVGYVTSCDTWENPSCTSALDPEACTDVFCSAICAFRAELEAECSRASAIVSDPGSASEDALMAVQMSAAPLNDVLLEGDQLILAASHLSLTAQEVAQEATLDLDLVGCYSTGVTTLTEAINTLVTAINGAEYALGAGAD
jgi:hypothetical protein